jgi:hypothetical protein
LLFNELFADSQARWIEELRDSGIEEFGAPGPPIPQSFNPSIPEFRNRFRWGCGHAALGIED